MHRVLTLPPRLGLVEPRSEAFDLDTGPCFSLDVFDEHSLVVLEVDKEWRVGRVGRWGGGREGMGGRE